MTELLLESRGTIVAKKSAPKALPVEKQRVIIEKYFQLEDPPIHAYTRAALAVEFHGIMKTSEEWASELEAYTRGESNAQ